MDFDYPAAPVEAGIVASQSGLSEGEAARLVQIGRKTRNLRGQGLDEGASTRMLIHAGRLIRAGLPLDEACDFALITPITDDADMRAALAAAIDACR